MLFGKKKKEEGETSELLKQLGEKIDNSSKLYDASLHKVEQMQQQMNDFEKTLKRHDMSLEDLLDEWSERQSDESQIRDQMRSLRETEEKFLKLFEVYQEELWAMHRLASTMGNDWQRQMQLMSQNVKAQMCLCGISPVEESGIPVDYALHEVVEVVETTDIQKNKTIAEVYRPGYVYRGRVKKKAQVKAFRYIER
ncbi:MAG: nucleotide exchange factor GrpE [Oliverpabstia sp.]|nr:nucleotide exchange factor GrpE [Eubacterium sp.]